MSLADLYSKEPWVFLGFFFYYSTTVLKRAGDSGAMAKVDISVHLVL